jgi:hypothetical protein
MEEYNLNRCARQLDVREAHLRRRERRCDHCDAEVHATRLRGMSTGRGRVTIEVRLYHVSFISPKKHVRSSSDTIRLVIKCYVLHAIIQCL